MVSFERFIQDVLKVRPNADASRIRRAYDFVLPYYHKRERYSRDPYIHHALAVTSILLPLKPDDDTIIASLLHGLSSENVSFDFSLVGREFGAVVQFMLEGLTAVKTLRPNLDVTDSESVRQMLLTIAKDLRVVLIRLADRLHNMETLQHLPPDKQKEMARETMEIFAPLASRLGIFLFKSRLEDLAFRYLNPSQYQQIEEQLSEFGREKGKFIEQIVAKLKSLLDEKGIEASVDGRLKNVYSIYSKLRRKGRTTLHEIFDVFAIRIIVPAKISSHTVSGKKTQIQESVDHLYSILGHIHGQWTPLPNRFKDYVAVPKPNGYQSLHTTVIGLAPKVLSQPIEIQIRSDQMHREAEYGIASHWLYEDTKATSTRFQKELFDQYTNSSDPKLQQQMKFLQTFSKIQQDIQKLSHESADMLAEGLRVDLFHDRIFVLTPDGAIKNLPVGSTPIDFAYSVHTDIGHRCAMAKVNGKLVPLDYELHNGDVVEIVLKSKPNPKALWLSFVKTGGARLKIKTWFNSQNREFAFREGKELLNKQLVRFGKQKLDDSLSLLKNLSGKTSLLRDRQKILENVGNGSMSVGVLMKRLFPPEELLSPLHLPVKPPVFAESLPRDSKKVRRKLAESAKSLPQKTLDKKILLGGESGMPLRFANCCTVHEHDPIVGYITRDQKATIHRADCRMLRRASVNRILSAFWEDDVQIPKKGRYRVRLFLDAIDRVGLIRDVTTVISDIGLNILNFGYREHRESGISYAVDIEIFEFEQLEKLFDRLETIPGVLKVRRDPLS